MAGDILEQLKSGQVCHCEAELRAVTRHEILRGRALATAVRGFLIEIDDGERCMKDEAPTCESGDGVDEDAASAAIEYNDQVRQRVAEIKQLLENGGG